MTFMSFEIKKPGIHKLSQRTGQRTWRIPLWTPWQIIACRSYEIALDFTHVFDFEVVHGGAICASVGQQCSCKSVFVGTLRGVPATVLVNF